MTLLSLPGVVSWDYCFLLLALLSFLHGCLGLEAGRGPGKRKKP